MVFLFVQFIFFQGSIKVLLIFMVWCRKSLTESPQPSTFRGNCSSSASFQKQVGLQDRLPGCSSQRRKLHHSCFPCLDPPSTVFPLEARRGRWVEWRRDVSGSRVSLLLSRHTGNGQRFQESSSSARHQCCCLGLQCCCPAPLVQASVIHLQWNPNGQSHFPTSAYKHQGLQNRQEDRQLKPLSSSSLHKLAFLMFQMRCS